VPSKPDYAAAGAAAGTALARIASAARAEALERMKRVMAASCIPNSDGNAVSAALFQRNVAFVSFDLRFFSPPAGVTPVPFLMFRRGRRLNGSKGRAR
jgi:hypothetical protein